MQGKLWKDPLHTLQVLHDNNCNIRKSAEVLGCSQQTVRAFTTQMGVKIPPRGIPVTADRVGQVAACVIKNDYNRAKAARELGITRERVQQILKRGNIILPSHKGGQQQCTQEEIEAAWVASKYIGKEAAKLLRVCGDTFCKYKKKYGLKRPLEMRYLFRIPTSIMQPIRDYCNRINIPYTHFVVDALREKAERDIM